MRLIFTRLKIYFKHKLALLSLVTLDSALAESIKSMLHALRVTLTLAPLVVRSIGFKVEVSATAKAKLERDKRGTPLDCRKSGDFFGAKGSREGINPFLRKEKIEKRY